MDGDYNTGLPNRFLVLVLEYSEVVPNDTAYKWRSCHSGYKLLCKLCRNIPPLSMEARFTVLGASQPYGPAVWLTLLPIKAGDVERNPGPAITHKQVWIRDICLKQIHYRKKIFIMCNRIAHWVHLRCAGIR